MRPWLTIRVDVIVLPVVPSGGFIALRLLVRLSPQRVRLLKYLANGIAMNIFFSVGEPSGDQHAAHLMQELKARRPDLRFCGFGGPQMEQAGLDSLFRLTNLAVMGFFKVIPLLFKFYRIVKQAERYFDDHKPDAVILVDFPGFNWWIARKAKARGIPCFISCHLSCGLGDPGELNGFGNSLTTSSQRCHSNETGTRNEALELTMSGIPSLTRLVITFWTIVSFLCGEIAVRTRLPSCRGLGVRKSVAAGRS